MEKEGDGERDREKVVKQVYRDDVVQSVAQPWRIGLVTKVGGDSDSDDSEEDEEEEEEHGDDVSEGSARVCWIKTGEAMEKVEEIKVIDRAYLHGDIVAKGSDPLGQSGTVVNVEMMVDLELGSGEIVKDVNSRRLRRVRAFALGDYVIHGMWIGRVDEVVDNVTVMFDDGAKCKVVRADPERLHAACGNVMDDADCPFFQGQKVRSIADSVFKSAKWLKGSWKSGRVEGTVVDVEAGSVLVYWIAAGNSLANSHPSALPNEEQDAKKLLPMIYFSHTNWQLGDRSLPPTKMRPRTVIPVEASQVDGIPSDADAEGSLEGNAAKCQGPETVDLNSCGSGEVCKAGGEVWPLHRRKGKQQRRAMKRDKKLQKKEKTIEYAVLVERTRTTVDVVWQDGSLEKGLDARSLIPVDHLGDHDFWPEQYVMERGSDGEGLDVEPRRIGVVRVVDAKQRTASVRWLKPPKGESTEAREFESEEVVSVYELVEHPDYSYCVGDVVLRMTSSKDYSNAKDNAELDPEHHDASGVEDVSGADPEEDESEAGRKKPTKKAGKRKARGEKPASQDLSWVGVIIGLQDGDIEVAWADGMVSKVGPHGILVVNRDIEDSSSAHTSDLEDGEDLDDAASWETVVSEDEYDRANQRSREDLSSERPSWDKREDASEPEDRRTETPSDASASRDDGSGTEESSSHNFGGPFKLPLVALGLVSRIASGLLGIRGGKKSSDPTEVETASSSQDQAQSSCGLQKILKGGATSGEQTPGSPPKRHCVPSGENLCIGDALYVFNEAVLKSMDLQDQEQDRSSLDTPRTVGTEDGESLGFVDSLETLEEEPNQHCGDIPVPTQDKSRRNDLSDENKAVSVKHFDCVKDPSDHHFLGETAQPTNRRWVKKIQQEWSILEKSLPDAIYVRVYEDRMDLLRAVIVGAPGTPYHDGLFVFDFYMPPEYPSTPPIAHYHSGGLRLNPNLYENGKVCLSLLNTWTGKGSEIWHPSTSSILQLLVSIQGLVLNEKPYYNEAGYDKQVGTGEGEKNSSVYNENSFLLSCKSMLYLLRRPPRHFEEFIGDHFRYRGQSLLLACQAYQAGAEVGSLKESDLSRVEDRNFKDESSAGFKLMLSKLMPKLVTAFEEVGANIKLS